ncbi:hypothetical protein LXA43DRAFT_153444 [Ganoderma leucocontextum]|nr:hypothetical protein LXA43DRAFT_153444 [Ganoderma leucocontextum]
MLKHIDEMSWQAILSDTTRRVLGVATSRPVLIWQHIPSSLAIQVFLFCLHAPSFPHCNDWTGCVPRRSGPSQTMHTLRLDPSYFPRAHSSLERSPPQTVLRQFGAISPSSGIRDERCIRRSTHTMRLLDLSMSEFAEFNDPSTTPHYAILSHRWAKKEQTYQDIRTIQESCERDRRASAAPPLSLSPSSSSHDISDPTISPSSPPPRSIWGLRFQAVGQIRGACEAARRDGFRYLWIDSCCIDKTSSSELSINSAWYRDAEVCYTFLVDVPTSSFASLGLDGSAFRSSEWFTRGWTLQELIAPRKLVFLSRTTWEPLGTKMSLAGLIEGIIGVPAS